MKNTRRYLPAVVTVAIALAQAIARADTAATIQTFATGTGVTYDGGGVNFPIVTAILSHPVVGTLDGYTYNNWAYFAADPSGSIDMFYSSTATGPAANYPTPTVGDQIEVQGTYSIFDAIPEIVNATNSPINVFGPVSTGNPPYYAVPTVTTISTINVGTNAFGINSAVQSGRSLAGTYLQLNNVTIAATGNFPTHANLSTTISDGANSMTMFFWASSYSTLGALGGTPIPQGPLNIQGFVDDFNNVAEFVPMAFIPVPEPSVMSLCGLGLAWVCYRLRRKA